MGVTGLWKLIDSSGKPVPLETLENKILAIDISIWLHQVIKGFQDAKGGTLPNAHLLGLFHRLCKLLFYKIKPIFVFDGGIPALKRQTMAKRAESKNKLLNEADRLQSLLLTTLAKEKVVQQALGGTAVDILARSPIKPVKGKSEADDMFKLPPIDESVAGPSSASPSPFKFNASIVVEEEPPVRKTAAHLNLHSIDVDSSNFRTLPADVRHEILTDMKETRKQNSWGRLHELPVQSDSFSSFQMKRLLKRRKVQVCLEDAEKEMGGQSLSVRDLEQLLTEEGVVAAAETNAKRIHSDDNTRFLMVSSVKQALADAVDQEKQNGEGKKMKSAELGPEFDDDLKKAVKMSLADGEEEGEGDEESQEIFMSAKQKSNLTEAAKEMARAYMMEYAGMSHEDVKAILEVGEGEEEDGTTGKGVNETLLELIEKNELKQAMEESLKEQVDKVDRKEEIIVSSDDSDDEFEEVKEKQEKEEKKTIPNLKLEIVIDPSKPLKEEEDLFADVFESAVDLKKELKEETTELPTIVEEIEDSSDNDEEIEKQDKCSDDQSSTVETKVGTGMKSNEIISLESDSDHLHEPELQKNNINQTKPEEIDETIQIDSEPPEIDQSKDALSTTKVTSIVSPQSILEALAKQKENIINITLDDIKAPTTSEPVLAPSRSLEDNSIIEIPDSPEGVDSEVTPSKKRTLTDYFETTTPRKTPTVTPDPKNTEFVPYVKSPFFVKKTPRKSSEKKKQLENSETTTNNKATKFLFSSSTESKEEPRPPPPQTSDLLKEASELLRSQKSTTELTSIAEDLRQQNVDLEQERNKQSRFGTSITERMSRECQEMLQLFGVPFIIAPMEAEAQCAFLDAAGITQGTVTDDSDVWLFGGGTVYKNFFDQRKHVLEYKMTTIERLFCVNREKLIQLALLVGSDYTPGITGIGAVTGLEILAQFPGGKSEEEEVNEFQGMASGLRRFKEWWTLERTGGVAATITAKKILRNKLKNIEIGEGFPSRAVIEAYLHPRIDDNRGEFSWGTPDAETIREFAKNNFGWTRVRTDELLVPVMKKLEERSVQRSIKNYFNCSSPATSNAAKMSKRVADAVRRMDPNAKEEPEVPKKKARKGRKVAEKKEELNGDSDCQVVEEEMGKEKKGQRRGGATVVIGEPVPGPSSATSSSSSASKRNRVVRIPETKQIIPQRDKMRHEEEERKKKAAEIFQNKKKNKGK